MNLMKGAIFVGSLPHYDLHNPKLIPKCPSTNGHICRYECTIIEDSGSSIKVFCLEDQVGILPLIPIE